MTTSKFEDIAKGFEVKELPQSEVEIVGEVPFDTIAPYRTAALAHLAEHMELPGFRPGKVPPTMAAQKLGDLPVLEEAVELFVKDFYPELVELKKLDVVGRPNIKITKLAPDNPVALHMQVALYPEVILPKDWKTIGGTVPAEPAAEATEEEVTQTIEDVRRNVAQAKAQASSAVPILDADGKPLPPALPELNDEFAKSVGAFESLDALKAQIKKGIGEEKARKASETRRSKIIDALLAKVTVGIPNVFVESELDKIMSQMQEDIERMGLKMEDYLKHVQKTVDQVRGEFRDQAHGRAKLQLTLNKIAKDENIEPDKELVENEMKHALEHFKDANQTLLRIHIESVLRNEKVLQLLEGKKEETK